MGGNYYNNCVPTNLDYIISSALQSHFGLEISAFNHIDSFCSPGCGYACAVDIPVLWICQL